MIRAWGRVVIVIITVVIIVVAVVIIVVAAGIIVVAAGIVVIAAGIVVIAAGIVVVAAGIFIASPPHIQGAATQITASTAEHEEQQKEEKLGIMSFHGGAMLPEDKGQDKHFFVCR